MTAPALRRSVAVVTGLALLIASAGPALAISDGEEPGRGLGAALTLGIFVGIPLALAAVIGLLVLVYERRKQPRYRPGRTWDHEPVWFAGPVDPDAALLRAHPGSGVTGGGASAEW